jgi:hypothetical protein
LAVVVVVLTGWVAGPARAQLETPYPGLDVPNYGQVITQNTLLRQALEQPGRRAIQRRERAQRRAQPKPRRPTGAQRSALRFAVTPKATAEAEAEFVAKFGADGVAPELVLADVRRMRDSALRDLARFGWRRHHLGDVAAFSLVVGTQFVNGKNSVPRAGALAVRRQVIDELARSKRVRRLPDARQQFAADLLLMRLAYSVGHVNFQRDVGDTGLADQELDRLADLIRTVFGVDPRDVKITKRGLVDD